MKNHFLYSEILHNVSNSYHGISCDDIIDSACEFVIELYKVFSYTKRAVRQAFYVTPWWPSVLPADDEQWSVSNVGAFYLQWPLIGLDWPHLLSLNKLSALGRLAKHIPFRRAWFAHLQALLLFRLCFLAIRAYPSELMQVCAAREGHTRPSTPVSNLFPLFSIPYAAPRPIAFPSRPPARLYFLRLASWRWNRSVWLDVHGGGWWTHPFAFRLLISLRSELLLYQRIPFLFLRNFSSLIHIFCSFSQLSIHSLKALPQVLTYLTTKKFRRTPYR